MDVVPLVFSELGAICVVHEVLGSSAIYAGKVLKGVTQAEGAVGHFVSNGLVQGRELSSVWLGKHEAVAALFGHIAQFLRVLGAVYQKDVAVVPVEVTAAFEGTDHPVHIPGVVGEHARLPIVKGSAALIVILHLNAGDLTLGPVYVGRALFFKSEKGN